MVIDDPLTVDEEMYGTPKVVHSLRDVVVMDVEVFQQTDKVSVSDKKIDLEGFGDLVGGTKDPAKVGDDLDDKRNSIGRGNV